MSWLPFLAVLVLAIAYMAMKRSGQISSKEATDYLKNGALVMTLAMGALLSAVVLLPRLGSEFLPELNEGALYVTFTLPPR